MSASTASGDDSRPQQTGGVPTQPTLRSGEIVLRPWTLDDVEAARLQHDEEIAHWFGFPGVIPSAEQQAQAIEDWHRTYAAGRSVVSFLVEFRGNVAGTVEVRQKPDRVGELSWAVFPDHRRQRVATTAVRMLVDYCFADLGLLRVEARVETGNLASLRTAGRAGLRREGVARQESVTLDRRCDFVHLARLSTDPPPTVREGFIGVLDAALPMKRVITQGLARNDRGQILLCELTYKSEWDLPGGVVDPLESPAEALTRELQEELGLVLPARRLILVNWLPPWHGWSDACQFVFDLGTFPADLIDGLATEQREIVALHWCEPADAQGRVAPYLAELLPRLVADGPFPLYLEAGRPLR